MLEKGKLSRVVPIEEQLKEKTPKNKLSVGLKTNTILLKQANVSFWKNLLGLKMKP